MACFRSRPERPEGREVVVLHKDSVGEIQTVVVPASHAHRVFVQVAQARWCFPSVDNAHIVASYSLHVGLGGGGDFHMCVCRKLRAVRSACSMLATQSLDMGDGHPGL